MKKFIALTILCVLVSAQTYSTTECSCSQLLSQGDCATNTDCSWDSSKKICAKSVPTSPIQYTYYCDAFNQSTCPQTNGCAWNGTKCTFFTGCSAFAKTTDQECKAISNKCITDGTHCVELGNCNSYLKSTSCIKNTSGALCYWDSNTCSDADTCEKLPTSYLTDAECRAKIPTCTTKNGGGCIESGASCSDQTLEIQCVTNKLSTQQCFWNGSKCVDKTCDNAPLTYTTDDQCKQYNSSCTTKQNGGCISRSTCSAALISAACVTNQQGSACYWNGNACVDKICSNAPSTLTSNSACSGFLTNCITTGSGCVTNGACSVAKIADACKKNSSGQDCIWDNNTCKEKICDNAPTTITTHDDCTKYLSTCTVKSNNQGCQNRSCNNAPTSITTNQDCESYLPKQNCITKLNGGCMTNTTCSSITVDKACIKDVNGKVCFWDNGTCKEKTCLNAPNTITDHQGCQNFLNTCTVNSTNNGCVDKTCENSLVSSICTTDLNNKACIYKGKCYQKQCVYAPSSYTTHQQCNQYLSNCTLNNTGHGCVEIPLKCEAITNKDACQIKKTQDGYADCGWDGQYCIDKGCTTIDKSINTTQNCNSQITGCVSANPINNVVSGCMDLPNTCGARKSQDNCVVSGTIQCVWNSNTKTCLDKTCATANIDGTTDKLSVFNTSNCNTYLEGCLMNNTEDGCISKVTNCSLLTKSDNCTKNSKSSNGQCYWNDSTCVDRICSNLSGSNHNDCNTLLDTCTYKKDGGCQQLGTCNSYQIKEQCVIDSNKNSCTWSNGACRNTICTDAPNTANYQTDSNCNNYSVLNDTCTVIARVNNVGCALRQPQCQNYIDEQQCKIDNSNNDCKWHNNQCFKKSTFTCANITLNSYSTQNCETVLYSCKASGNSCVAKDCTDYVNKNGLTSGTAVGSNDDCSNLNNTCTLKNSASKSCQIRQSVCTAYGTDQDSCTVSDEGTCIFDGTNCVGPKTACTNFTGTNDGECSAFRQFCKYPASQSGSQSCEAHVCEDLSGSNLTYELCQEYDSSCSVKSDGSGCVTKQAQCTGYGTTQLNCYKSTAGYCVVDTVNGNTCIAATATNCALITGNNLTDTQCSQINSACIANRDGTKCQVKQQNCTDIQLIDNCTRSNTGECIGSLADGTNGSKCILVSQSTQCSSIYLGTNNYTDQNCYKKNPKCTNNSNTGCQDRTCSNKSSPTNFDDCYNWLNTCTFNNSNACTPISQTCSLQSTSNCYRAVEGDCTVIGTQCVKKTCDNAPTSKTDHSQCSTYLNTCTVAKVGGCTSRQACNQYTTQLQCTKNLQGKDCYWSVLNNNCVDLTCANIDQSNSYTTHSNCETQLNTCTIRQLNGSTAQGCVSKGTCSSYTIKEQCQVNMNGDQCQWIESTTSCVDRNCSTAPTSLQTHTDCQNYYKINTQSVCTVAALAGENGNPATLGGCQLLANCSSYISEEQCQINATNSKCAWNGQACGDYSCLTAPKTDSYNSDNECKQYKQGCTVDNSGTGCMELQDKCESYQLSENCLNSKNGQQCYWDNVNNLCITKTCDNAPIDSCSDYLQGCTIDTIKCKVKVCEDYQFNTDQQCSTQAMSTCTTDGTKCITRGTCYQALNQAGCVKDINNQQCEWINNEDSSYCTIKSCLTAPIDKYTTEQQCSKYYTNCTTKKGGGCITKTTCAAVNIEQACTTALDGTNCQWDNGTCRNKDCQDYTGKTHADCQTINSNCTIGLNGKCARIKTCSNTTIKNACVNGTDGPCLWIDEYINQDNSKGACFPYTSCKSMNWNKDQQCKLISNQCTTNGTNCISITQCSETNTNGGCITGYDGECIQTIKSLASNDPPICKLYNSCNDAYYLTHQECQNAYYKCTTNGTTGCIPLSTCQSYTQQLSCNQNAIGQIIKDNLITSTGYCTWDNNQCRDQICDDLIGTTHNECNLQLSTCTSNGTKCLTKSNCSTYQQNACNIGTDGICYWDITKTSCRVKQCSDIQNGTTYQVCNSELSSCISNGTICIPKANCSTYTTKTACNQGGLDGICVFTQSTQQGAGSETGTCQLMTQCSTANNDQQACEKVSNKCLWTPSSGTTQSKCTTHTCATYLQTNKVCGNFKSWNNQYQQICKLIQGTCKEVDPNSLLETECYTISSYSYTWNQSTSKCQVCTTPINPNNTNNSNQTNDNVTSTEYGYIISITILLGYLILI